jgi:adenine phosphoribosyltransferase
MNKRDIVKKILKTIPQDAIGKYELLPIAKDIGLFAEVVKYLATPFIDVVDYVAAPEATGWILATAIAKELNIGFIPIRKGGRLPYPQEMLMMSSYTDYTQSIKHLELKRSWVDSGNKILLVDEWVETGAAMMCCIEMLESLGGTIMGLATIGMNTCPETASWVNSGFLHFIGKDMIVFSEGEWIPNNYYL